MATLVPEWCLSRERMNSKPIDNGGQSNLKELGTSALEQAKRGTQVDETCRILGQSLTDSRPDRCVEAARWLAWIAEADDAGQMSATTVFDQVLELLSSENGAVCAAAATALGAMRTGASVATPRLFQALKSEHDDFTKIKVARAMIASDAEVEREWMGFLLEELEEAKRWTSAAPDFVQRFGSVQDVSALSRLLGAGSDPFTRKYASLSLAELGSAATPALGRLITHFPSDDGELGGVFLRAIRYISFENDAAWFEFVRCAEADVAAVRQIGEFLGPPPKVEEILRRIITLPNNGFSELKKSALQQLRWQWRYAWAVDAISDHLLHGADDIRKSAAGVLSSFGPDASRGIDALMAYLAWRQRTRSLTLMRRRVTGALP